MTDTVLPIRVMAIENQDAPSTLQRINDKGKVDALHAIEQDRNKRENMIRTVRND